MSEAAEDQVKQDTLEEEETEEEKRYRSYREDADTTAKASQKYPEGHKVWFKSPRNGAYAMFITEASHDPITNTWSYLLESEDGEKYNNWVPETRLSASQPKKR